MLSQPWLKKTVWLFVGFTIISTRQQLVFDTSQLFQIIPGILGIFKGKDGKKIYVKLKMSVLSYLDGHP